MKKRQYIIIHCTATQEGKAVTSDDIRKWHLSPAPQGRGWHQVGYADMVKLDGTVENLVKYNNDQWVDGWELTNGVAGINSESLHIVYAGGLDANMKPKNTMTPSQEASLRVMIFNYLRMWPDVKIAGHNQFDNKACPSFDTVAMCRKWGVPEQNIYKK